MQLYTQQEEKFHLNLNFAISPMANLLNLYSAYIEIFTILLMIAYIRQNSKIQLC